ncbi:MAG: hypothetical protein A2W25_07970 [candidate division Zixibacteria bacterium RBG_16_53_22]|nr:MAG: hypothetical protein A2W25_07970 [candidate division Zixibacteria bacterium RBG_16_53_22]
MSKSIPVIMLLFLLGLSPLAGAQSITQMMASSGNLLDDDDLNLPSYASPGQERPHEKSRFLALGLSFVLPGAGQYYTENKSKTIIFGGAEAMIWGGFFGLRQYGGWKKDDYRAWAAFHAGADVNDKPDIYYEKLTYYDNLNEYNQLAPLYDGDEATLFPATRDYYWNWDSDGSRDHYRSLRNQSKNAYRRSLFLLGAALINRVLAGIDAYRAASYYEEDSEFGLAGWNAYCQTNGPLWDHEVRIGIARKF